ncbi:MAG: glutamate formimidoyltransferase [Syntrophales bacterium LBB04]|nr:glutamate formimidoyltransferase [Syntrophales bacterium LBB04]
MKIIECVPNISEGRNKKKIKNIVAALTAVEGVNLLDVCTDADHNRAVLTFIGTPEDSERGAAAVCDRALEMIDMCKQKGVHHRIGAVDVVPFIPLKGATMKETVDVAHRFGYAFGERNEIPVYFYGEAALDPARKELSAVRKGEYEALKTRIEGSLWRPDAGPARFNPKSGAVAVGAREILIAFNINLASKDLELAKKIAISIRQSSGGLPHVKAIGVPLKSKNIIQVAINLTNYKVTSLRKVFDTVKEQALKHGVSILESELIGLIPEDAMYNVSAEYLKLSKFCSKCIIETYLSSLLETK